MAFDGLAEEVGEARLLSAVFDTSEIIMAMTNPRGSVVKVSQAFRDTFGYLDRECLGRPIWAFRSLGEAARGRRSFGKRTEESDGIFKTEADIWRAADGTEIMLKWTVQIIRDDNEKEIARIGTAQNLTAIRAAEEERRILQVVTNSLSEPLFFINPDGTIRYASQAVERVYGYRPEQLVGKPSSILRPVEAKDKMAEYLARLQKSRQPEMIETEALHFDGSLVPVELRTSPVFDQDGEFVGLSSVVHDMTERLELEEELRRLAGTDPLTGLANRLGFRTAADHEVKRAQRYKHPLAVFVSDIDHFKKVNDTYGHAAGDAALVRFADLLGWSLRRPIDHVARTGGEEFVAILPQTDSNGGLCAAERVRASTEQNLFAFQDDTFPMTASFGVSIWHEDEEDLGDAVQRADEALYEAKSTGRNRVVFRDSAIPTADRLAG